MNRQWLTGANRNTDNNKVDYEGIFHPLVKRAFGEYMLKHSYLEDGTKRASDNWQNWFGTDKEHLDTCIKSAYRHFEDWHLEHRGYESRDGLDEAINGLLFNVMAYYAKILDERYKKKQHNKLFRETLAKK